MDLDDDKKQFSSFLLLSSRGDHRNIDEGEDSFFHCLLRCTPTITQACLGPSFTPLAAAAVARFTANHKAMRCNAN